MRGQARSAAQRQGGEGETEEQAAATAQHSGDKTNETGPRPKKREETEDTSTRRGINQAQASKEGYGGLSCFLPFPCSHFFPCLSFFACQKEAFPSVECFVFLLPCCSLAAGDSTLTFVHPPNVSPPFPLLLENPMQ